MIIGIFVPGDRILKSVDLSGAGDYSPHDHNPSLNFNLRKL